MAERISLHRMGLCTPGTASEAFCQENPAPTTQRHLRGTNNEQNDHFVFAQRRTKLWAKPSSWVQPRAAVWASQTQEGRKEDKGRSILYIPCRKQSIPCSFCLANMTFLFTGQQKTHVIMWFYWKCESIIKKVFCEWNVIKGTCWRCCFPDQRWFFFWSARLRVSNDFVT